MVEFKEVEQRPEDGTVDVDDALDTLLSGVGERMLFEERPVGLTALFRFQTGSNIFDGHEFAKEAWTRVMGKDGEAVNYEHQSLSKMKKQKETVKKELKLFEVHFDKFYGRPPSRLDKECLRRLYEYHKQLKALIAAKESRPDDGMINNNSTNNKKSISGNSKNDYSNNDNNNVVSHHSNNLPPVSLSSSGQIPSATPKSDVISSVERIGPASPGGGSIGGGDLKALKAEKRMLKVKLRKFEEEYVKEHGHKPHSYQEVGSIRSDYARYKFLKEAVGETEQRSARR